ncbi:hypothetical protein [Kosakonia cowanii]|uniref:hypothetical protein n=1 Tax=Kosakonia cowanii TaxID=208223 RepID=UPI0028A9415D|nr:hypothetical protein [Kosakonia cowanii]
MKVDIYKANHHKYKFLVVEAGSELGESLGVIDPHFKSVSVYQKGADLDGRFPISDVETAEKDITSKGYHIYEFNIDVDVEIKDMPR